MRTLLKAPPKTEVASDLFVVPYQMEDTLPCVVVIDHANRHDRWFDSLTRSPESEPVPEHRDSHQLNFSAWSPALEHEPILAFAQECLEDYLAKLPCANNFPPFSVQERYNILKYEPGQAYHAVHSDYAPHAGNAGRHLTFVCFLNTVEKGGELEFVQQSLRVQPVEGRAVIFPSGWTHAHHTLPASEDRYVFQLWWSFND